MSEPQPPGNSRAKTRTIKVDYLARVEGEGALHLKISNGEVEDVSLKIFEPPRFFEAFLRGRAFHEAPDITARICGICPVAYQMSACHAMESAAKVRVQGKLRDLRRLLYCGEWIESHALHIFMLHAPDFLGFESAIEMAKEHREKVEMGLRLKKIGNDIGILLGGREIHPVNVKLGGFYKVPTKKALEKLRADLEWGIDVAIRTVEWVAQFPFPDFDQEYEFVSLSHPHEYPMCEGSIVSSSGLDIEVENYEEHFEEEHVPYTNALHSVLKGRGAYFVGPMARFHHNFDRLTDRARQVSQRAGLDGDCVNPFKSIIVRSVEVLYAFEEALRVVDNYIAPESSAVEVKPTNCTGYGCTEAPRGILYHRYDIDRRGEISLAKIVPPTSQNQKTIERDLYRLIPQLIDLSDDQLQWRCEQAIRNYDPCISCATHFLKVTRNEG